MRLSIGVALFVGAVASPAALAGTPAASGDERDWAVEVRAVFACKCAACHGSDLPKPKGRFGYVLDLRKVAKNPEMVIPFKPEESELWQLVRSNEMPPPDSP